MGRSFVKRGLTPGGDKYELPGLAEGGELRKKEIFFVRQSQYSPLTSYGRKGNSSATLGKGLSKEKFLGGERKERAIRKEEHHQKVL